MANSQAVELRELSELDLVTRLREAMRLAGHKLPVRTKFVLREDG